MSKKYRVRLINDRIVGPFSLSQIGELYKKGHIKGQEKIQQFPAGDWKPLQDEREVKAFLAKIISKKESNHTTVDHESTVARINLGNLKKEEIKKRKEKEEKSKNIVDLDDLDEEVEDEQDDAHKEFTFDRENNETIVNYEELEKKYNEQNPEQLSNNENEEEPNNDAEDGIEKTVVLKRPDLKKKPASNEDKTVVNQEALKYFKELERKKKEEEERKQRELEEKQKLEEEIKEDEVDFDESTVVFDKKSLVALKVEAKELETALVEEEKAKEKSQVEDKKEEEYEVVEEEPPKKKMKPIVALAFLVVFWFLLEDDSDKSEKFKPKYVKIVAPITFEVESAQKAKQFYEKGLADYRKGSYIAKVNAIVNFKTSIEHKFKGNPALGFLILTYGEIFRNVSNKSKGAAILFNLIKITRSRALTDVNIALGTALFYRNNGKVESAIDLMEKFLRVGKPTLKFYALYLDMAIDTGDLVKAKRVKDKIIEYPDLPIEAYIALSKYYTLDQRYSDGKESVLTGLNKYPSSVALLLELASYQLREENLKAYQTTLKKVEALNYEQSPRYYAEYLENVGILSAFNKDVKTAAFLFKKALQISDSDRLRSKLASLDIGGGQLATKLILESKAMDLIRESKKLMKEKKWELAFIEAIAATELEINYLPANLHLIDLQIKRGFYESAIDTLEFLKKEYPTHPGVNFKLIKALYESNKMDEAQTQVNIISNSPLKQNPLYYSVVGRFYEKSNKNILAIKFLNKSVSLNPLRDEDYYVMALIYNKSRQYTLSKSALSEAIALNPLNIEYKSLYGEILFELEGAETAIGYVESALKENKDNPKLLGDMATFYYRNGQLAQFKDVKERIEKLNSNDPAFYEFLIKAAQMEENNEHVIKYAKELIIVNPGDVETRMTLAYNLMNVGRYQEALEAIEGVTERLSTYPGAYYLSAKIYIEIKNYAKALEAGKKEKENNPGIYNGFYILGETYRLMGKVQEAVDNLELAISISPRNVESLISLGLIKIAQRNYDIARELFLRAKKQEPANPKIRKQLGFIYQGVGQSGLAIEEFQTYLKLFPNAPDRDQVLGRIQVLSR